MNEIKKVKRFITLINNKDLNSLNKVELKGVVIGLLVTQEELLNKEINIKDLVEVVRKDE